MLGLSFFFWANHDSKKIMDLRKKAKEVRDKNPDKAIKLLEKVAKIEEKRGGNGSYIRLEIVKILYFNGRTAEAEKMLQAEYDNGGNPLEIATILYCNGRNDEAERILLDEYVVVRKWKIGKDEVKAANKMYKDRMKALFNSAKFMGEEVKDYEIQKELAEFPDFSRNIYCKNIYSKLRIFYERNKQYEKAVPWAMAEAYAKYENHYHGFSKFGDPIIPDFKPVLRCLKKCKREAEMPELEKIFWQYADPPDSERCWRMIDEQFTQQKPFALMSSI